MIACYVYVHYKPDGTPFYVGKGSGNRAYEMVSRRRNAWHQRVTRKYGQENIKIGLINCESEEEAFSLEICMIAELRRAGFDLANFSDGGEGPLNPCEETRLKMSIAKKGHQYWLGKKHGPSARAKMSKAKIGRPLSIETRRKMSLVRQGKTQSEETKRKRGRTMSARRAIQFWSGRPHPPVFQGTAT